VPAYEFEALDRQGRSEKGILEGDSARQVRQILRDRALAPLKVELTSAASQGKLNKTGASFDIFGSRLSVSDRALVTRQLATLIAAGLSVEESLLAVSKQTESAKTQLMLVTVRAKVMEGYSFAKSLQEYPRAFPSLYRATVEAGESAGHLEQVLNQLADFSEAQYASGLRIQQAMIYPVLLLILTVAILAGLLGYVVPDIVDVFADTGQALPALTQMIIGASDFVMNYGLLLVVLVVFSVIGFRRLLAVAAFRLKFDQKMLHLPIVAKMSRGRNTAQFASTLSILSSSGVPLVDAMQISGGVVSNTWLRLQVKEATVKVREGSSLQSALEQSGYFPPMMLYMIASGEASGELDQMLERVAKHMQQDVEVLLATLLSLIGPLMLVLMGGAVFTIVMAILLPIINLNQLVV